QRDGTDAGGGQRLQLVLIAIAGPDLKFVEGGIVFIDPAVVIAIEFRQFPEAVVGAWPEQFAAVVDLAVLVAVEDQEAAARGDEIDLLLVTVGIQVEGEAL